MRLLGPAARALLHTPLAPQRGFASLSMPALADPSLFRQQSYIDGRWCDADGGGTLEVVDPASGAALGRVPDMGGAETRRGNRAKRFSPGTCRTASIAESTTSDAMARATPPRGGNL